MRWLAQLALLIGILVLVPGIGTCFKDLAQAGGQAVANGFATVESMQTPGLGEQVLPPTAWEIVRMARSQSLGEFRIAPSLAADPLILQRVTEGAWPIRFAEGSPNAFFPVREALPGNCTLRATGTAVKYATCL